MFVPWDALQPAPATRDLRSSGPKVERRDDLNVADELRRVELYRALALTVLLGRQGDERYPASARRFS
jgi:hypothetical protein